jgi:chromosome segregation ATPase
VLAQELEQTKQSLAEAQKTLEDTRADAEGLITKLREELTALRQEVVGLRHQTAAAAATAELHKRQAEMATMLAEEVKTQNAMLTEQLQKERSTRNRKDEQVTEVSFRIGQSSLLNKRLSPVYAPNMQDHLLIGLLKQEVCSLQSMVLLPVVVSIDH